MNKFYILMEEEEAGGGSGGGYYSSTPADLDELKYWWDKITEPFDYPLYAVFIASERDQAIREFIDSSREELKEISAQEICFMYFRDIHKARRMEEWDIKEHLSASISMGRILGTRVPSIIFLKDLGDMQSIQTISLRKKSEDELLLLFRDFFYHIRNDDSPEINEKINNTIHKMKIRELTKTIVGQTDKTASEFFKTLGKSIVGWIG